LSKFYKDVTDLIAFVQ